MIWIGSRYEVESSNVQINVQTFKSCLALPAYRRGAHNIAKIGHPKKNMGKTSGICFLGVF